MILSTHILAGAAIGSEFNDLGLIFILALSSHYVLDAFPHLEIYFLNSAPEELKNLRNKKVIKNIIKAGVDFWLGMGLVIVFGILAKADLLPLLIGGAVATAPDALQLLYYRAEKQKGAIKVAQAIHKWAHFDKNKYRSKAVRLTTTLAVSLIAALILIF